MRSCFADFDVIDRVYFPHRRSYWVAGGAAGTRAVRSIKKELSRNPQSVGLKARGQAGIYNKQSLGLVELFEVSYLIP